MVKKMLSVVIGMIALIIAVPWLLYFVVRVATTSYSIDWVDLDKVDSVFLGAKYKRCTSGLSSLISLHLLVPLTKFFFLTPSFIFTFLLILHDSS